MAISEELKLIITTEATEAIRQLDQVRRHTIDIEAISKRMTRTGAVMSAAVTAPLILLARKAVQAAGVQVQAEAKLAAAIEARGEDVDELMKKYRDFASGIQAVTTVGDEQVLALAQLAFSYGVTEDKIEEAVTGAIGLSKAYKVDMATALRGVALGLEGTYTILTRYIPELQSATDEAGKAAAMHETMARGFALARAEALTGTGQMEQLANVLGDLQEAIGVIIIPVLVELSKHLKNAADWFMSLDEKTQANIVKFLGIAAAIGPLLLVGGQLLTLLPLIGAAFALMGSTVGIVIGIVLAVGVAAAFVIKYWEPISGFFVNLWKTINEAFYEAYLFIKDIVDRIWDELANRLASIIEPVKKVAEGVKGAFDWLKDKLVGHSVVPDMVDEILEEFKRTEQIAGILKTSFGDAFTSIGEAMAKGEDGWAAFGEAAKAAIAKVLEALGQMALVKAVAALAKALGGDLKAFAEAAAWGAAAAAAFTGSGLVKALGEGGVVTRPTLAMVGERGPEAVIPLRKGGMGPTVNVYVQGSVIEEQGLARRLTEIQGRFARGY